MPKIVNDNKLNLILTQHGLNRIAEAISDPSVNIEISNIRLGSGNNNEYYTPLESQDSLKGDLGISIPVVEKNLLEDGQTVSFRSIISENIGNIDIREIGLYENYNGVETLFAISTQQPFVKPSIDYGYIISLDYFVFLKVTSMAEVYDQIVLSPEHNLVSETDMETFMTTILFNHGNILNQIGNNSRVIGYDRATQLYEIIRKNQQSVCYTTACKNFGDLNAMLNNSNGVISYWLFDSPQGTKTSYPIVDMSSNRYNLSVSNPNILNSQEYVGLTSTLTFPANDYFYIEDSGISFPNNSYYTFIFALEPLVTSATRTLLAQSDYATNSHVFEIKENSGNSIEVTLFTDKDNYITFRTSPNAVPFNGAHSVVISVNPRKTNTSVIVYINGVRYETTKTITGTYDGLGSSSASIASCIFDPMGNPIDTINAKVGLIAIIKAQISNSNSRIFSLLLEAALGRNPYLNRN